MAYYTGYIEISDCFVSMSSVCNAGIIHMMARVSLASHPTCFRQRRLGSTPIVWPLFSVECLQRYDLVRANKRRDRLVGAKGGGRS